MWDWLYYDGWLAIVPFVVLIWYFLLTKRD
jgi:hypothetical protein